MRHISFEYVVYLNIQLSAGDIRLLRHFSERHYDHVCKSFFVPGPRASGNGWRHFAFSSIDPFDESVPADTLSDADFTRVTFDDLDICLKILEGVSCERDEVKVAHAFRLTREIRGMIEAMQAEHKRVIKESHTQ